MSESRENQVTFTLFFIQSAWYILSFEGNYNFTHFKTQIKHKIPKKLLDVHYLHDVVIKYATTKVSIIIILSIHGS